MSAPTNEPPPLAGPIAHIRSIGAAAQQPIDSARTIPGSTLPGLGDIAGVYVVDLQGRVLAANGIALRAVLTGDPRVIAALQQIGVGGADLVIDVQIDSADRETGPLVARLNRLEGDDGPLALVEIFRRPMFAEFRRDPLTELADRAAIAHCVDAWRREAAPRSVRFAVLFLDLDDFKQINDRYGHSAGDEVLKTLASRWLACVRDHDLVARYGGDEFVVLVKDAATAEEIGPVVRRLREAAERPLDLGDVETRVSVTIGIETCESTDRSIEELIAAADRDMYARKRASRL